jgi:arylsulfatase A-like enzyme
MRRREFLKAAGVGAAAMAVPRWAFAAEAAKGRPNIIFIMADDMGYGDPHCNNPDSKVPTPNMDRLAAQGVRFTDAHSGSAVCSPTRYGVVTGRYSWRTSLKKGVLWGYSPPLIEPERLTIASLLRQQGYATACFGKWHLGLGLATKDGRPAAGNGSNVDFSKPITGGPTALGFDHFFGISASLDMPPYAFVENDRWTAVPTEMTKEGGREGLTAPGFKAVDVMPKLTERACGWIDAHAKASPGRPFFIYFPLTAPHTPLVPAGQFKGASKAGKYGDFVAQCDWTIGEVMKALDRNGLAENTLLMVSSDNGSTMKPMTEFGHLPNYSFRGRKSDIWDGGHREPFLARWPGRIKPGTTCDEPIVLSDLMATCAAIVGADLPDNAAEDSLSFLPALLGEKLDKPIHEAVVHHSIDGMFAIRTRQWKLVLGRGSGGWDGTGSPTDPPGQLYDMQADPSETTNLYTSRSDVVKELTAVLERCQREGRSRPRRG